MLPVYGVLSLLRCEISRSSPRSAQKTQNQTPKSLNPPKIHPNKAPSNCVFFSVCFGVESISITTNRQHLVFFTRFLFGEDGLDRSDSRIGLLCLIRENPCTPCPIAFGLCLWLCRAVSSVAYLVQKWPDLKCCTSSPGWTGADRPRR